MNTKNKSLKVVSTNGNFFGKVAGAIRNILVPTRIGINSFYISRKRHQYIKMTNELNKAKQNLSSKREEIEKRYNTSYNEYLESVDRYIMDSIYAKVNTQKATNTEKKALSEYYKISVNKNEQYDEYRYRKQIFLLELDYLLQKESNKKIDARYEEIYCEKMSQVYRKLLKDYSIRLIDTTTVNESAKQTVYLQIFKTLKKYVNTVLPLELEYSKTNKYASITNTLEKYKGYTGKLNEKEALEKNLILLELSRVLFTHSLPLSTTEECYLKLIKDTEKLILKSKSEEKRRNTVEMIKLIIEHLFENILNNKIYWENPKVKKYTLNFWKKYKKEKNKNNRTIMIIIYQLNKLYKEKLKKEKELRKYYNKLLHQLGTKYITGVSKIQEEKKYVRQIEQ
ncbi:MAG: hypothetical protein ACTTGJ_03390 [Clostridium sp.]